MSVYNIPIKYRKGIYGIKDFEKNTEDVLELNHDDLDKIVTYNIPNSKRGRKIRLYAIPKDILEDTLRAVYSDDGHLKKITANINNKDILLYINYESRENAIQEIKSFAIENAKYITEKVCMCKDLVSRLFVEYFNDGEYMDFHAKIGTEIQKIALKKKYPDKNYIVDCCGDYPSEIIDGDNDRLKIMVLCADQYEMDFFQLAVGIMTKYIKKEAAKNLNKTDDFKFLCEEYD